MFLFPCGSVSGCQSTVLGSLSLMSLMVSVDVKHRERKIRKETAELRSCVEIEMTVLGSPSLISLMVSVDGNQH